MRVVTTLIALLVVFLLGGYVDHTYEWPFGLLDAPATPLSRVVAGSAISSVPLPNFNRGQGVQDLPRATAPAGANTDFQRCMTTMLQRRESEQEARNVCQKIMSGISGR